MMQTKGNNPAGRWMAALFATALLAGCGSGGGGGGGGAASPPPPPPPPANQAPTASFLASASVAAGAPLALDASASSDPDNDVLVFTWDFGDGTHGGGAQIAHVYPSGGTYTVTLTVADGRGGTATATSVIDVSPAAAPGAPVTTTILVNDASGPLSGVLVSVVGTAASASTGADGKASIATGVGAPLQLRFSRSGYADQFKTIQLPPGADSAYFEVTMQPREAALTLGDAAAGGTLTGKDGSVLTLPAGALIDASGNPVSGPVHVNVTPVDVGANAGAFPGLFQGYQPSGTRGLIASYGTVEYVLTQNGAPVRLAPGQKATIEIPIYTSLKRDGSAVVPGDVIPLWSLDERTSAWTQEGQGTVVANAASPSELALRAEVSHFSWWNCDQWLGAVPGDSYNPNVKCCIRDTPNGPCKENSGDICSHSGNGPAQLSGASGNAGVRIMAASPATRRLPTTAAFTTAPAIAGAVLPMPADLDITLVSTARNGTYRGTRVLRGAAGVSEDVTVDVLPVAGGGNDDAITLPWDQVYSMQTVGEVDRYRLTLPVGPGFELRVAQATSALTGSVKVTRPDGSVVGQVPFGATAAMISESTVAAAGEYTIEITAGSNAPGAYRLDAASYGTCSSTQTLALPATPMINLGPRQALCFDITLAADDVIRIQPVQAHNGVAGSFSLATAGGVQQLAVRAYPGNIANPTREILAGVATAGTYRLRVANTTLNTGVFEMALSKPAAEALNVPDARTVTDLVAGTPRLYVVRPPANGPFHLMLSATGLEAGADITPDASSFLVGCNGCGTPVTQSTARVAHVAAPLLPVVTLFRNVGVSAGTVVVATGVPTVIGKDVDVSGSVGATPAVYTFQGTIGDQIASGFARPEASSSNAALTLFAPSGASVTNGLATLPENGAYTALMSALSGSDSAFTFRINTAPAAVPLALTAPLTQQTLDLPLGQVVRYTFELAQGELIGLRLATPGPLSVTASVAGVNNLALSTPTSGTGPFSVATAPMFVNNTGSYTLTLRAQLPTLERASGNVTVGIVKPAPDAATFNTAVAGSLAFGEWTSYRYVVPATGRYLLRVTSSSTPSAFGATVWAGSSPLSNYAGEFTSSWSTFQPGTDGLGQLAAGTSTVTVRNGNGGSGATPFAVVLVDLESPVALTPGAAATAGLLDIEGERDYFAFDGVGGQAYTVRVTAGFNGTLRVRKRNPNGDFTNRTGEIINVGGTPVAFANGVEQVVAFTIPNDAQFGNGVYIVEVAGEGAATGAYTVRLTTP